MPARGWVWERLAVTALRWIDRAGRSRALFLHGIASQGRSFAAVLSHQHPRGGRGMPSPLQATCVLAPRPLSPLRPLCPLSPSPLRRVIESERPCEHVPTWNPESRQVSSTNVGPPTALWRARHAIAPTGICTPDTWHVAPGTWHLARPSPVTPSLGWSWRAGEEKEGAFRPPPGLVGEG